MENPGVFFFQEEYPVRISRIILHICTMIIIPIFLFSEDRGLVIAFAGLSGSGKTTMAKALATLHPCHPLIEPEESDWPSVIRKRDIFGNFTMWMGFRQLWIPLQYDAQRLKNSGQIAILDSYFIKIIGFELEEGVEWLFPKDDPYYPVFRHICQLDIDHLPDPDCIILFDLSYSTWIQLLASRSRDWDNTPGFLESYQQTKGVIEKAVRRLCNEKNIKLIYFQQEFGDVKEQANRLYQLLLNEKILSCS